MALTPNTNSNHGTTRRDFGNPIIQAALLLIVFVLFTWFILKPKLSKSMEQRTNLKAAQAQLDGIKSDKQKLSQLVSELRNSEEDVAKVDEALPLNGRVSKVYVMLDEYVRTAGMTLTLISADDTSKSIAAGDKSLLANPFQEGRQLHTITLTTTVTGNMEQFKNLLQLIETSGRVLNIDSVEVIGDDSVTKFIISVKAYAYEPIQGVITK